MSRLNKALKVGLTLLLLLLALLGTLSVSLLSDRAVTFTDPHMEMAIRAEINHFGKPIYQSQLRDVIALDLAGKDIQDLSGIEHLRYLERLNLDDNHISDVTPLRTLYRLTHLSLNNNGIIDLGEAGFDTLTHLYLIELSLNNNVQTSETGDETRLSDIGLLGKLTDLQDLRLNHNHIRDISPLSQAEELTDLELRDNRIQNIAPLYSLSRLTNLDLSRNQIDQISDLSSLTQLERLNLRENFISDIRPISALEDLVYLNLHSNESIQSISPLSHLTHLESLILENIPVGEEVSLLESMPKLLHLNLQNCGISDYAVIGDLMAKGALQDIPELSLQANVNLRDNLLPKGNFDPLAAIRPYWENVTVRNPYVLPNIPGLVDPPKFSHQGGFFNDGFLLTISAEDTHLEIYYTLDGSDPDPQQIGHSSSAYQNTNLYSGPIPIKERTQDVNKFSAINTTHVENNIPWSPPPNVYKGTVVRAVTYDPHTGYQSPILTQTYFVDHSPDLRYSTLPVISLTADYDVLFNPEGGILNTGVDGNPFFHLETRVPANLEYFEPGGSLGFSGLYEIKLHGNTSVSNPQKGFHVYAEPWLGQEKINYPLFINAKSKANQLVEFDRFIIRAWGTAFDWDVFFSDAYHQTLMAESDLDIQDYQPAVVFINGEYWGLYEIREANKNAEYFHAHYFNNQDIPLDILEMGTVDFVESGSPENWFALLDFIDNHDIRLDENYAYVQTQMDIDNFLQYIIHCIFTGKKDWPIHNEALWRVHDDDGQWRWIQFDMDQGLRPGIDDLHDMVEQVIDETKVPHPLLIALLENETFKIKFLNTFADMLNTYFLTSVEIEHFDQMAAELEPYIPEFQARWHLEPDWEKSKSRVLDLIENRWAFRKNQILKNFEIDSTHKITLVFDKSMGTVGINNIILSNDLPGVIKPGNWMGYYFDAIPITVFALPKEGYRFVEWETLADIDHQAQELVFIPDEDIELVAIFEKCHE